MYLVLSSGATQIKHKGGGDCHPLTIHSPSQMCIQVARVIHDEANIGRFGTVQIGSSFDVFIDLSKTTSHMPAKFIQIQCDMSR